VGIQIGDSVFGYEQQFPEPMLSTAAEPDTLEDVDLIWGDIDDVPNREWSKLDDDFTNVRPVSHISLLESPI
jgi:hypothetical protein